eukprot:6477811-Amphidinium_carterae.1
MKQPLKALQGCHTGPVGPIVGFPQKRRRLCDATCCGQGAVARDSALDKSAHTISAHHATTADRVGCGGRAREQQRCLAVTPQTVGLYWTSTVDLAAMARQRQPLT